MSLNTKQRILLLATAAAAPALLTNAWLLWRSDASALVAITCGLLLSGLFTWCLYGLHLTFDDKLHQATNLLEGLRSGEVNQRANLRGKPDAMFELMQEINQLSLFLNRERVQEQEAGALLSKVMAAIDVPLLAFDSHHKLTWLNEAACTLWNQVPASLLGCKASDLGLAQALKANSDALVPLKLPNLQGRHHVKTRVFREKGRPQTLVIITDLSRELRREEIDAWRRLIRVFGHEINNAMTPISSTADTLKGMLQDQPRAADFEQDMTLGLEVIAARASGLRRFMAAYAKLSSLPPIRPEVVTIKDFVGNLARSETRAKVHLLSGPDISCSLDSALMGQALLNLLSNAVEAGGPDQPVDLSWHTEGHRLVICVRDRGPGITNPQNLFVPFYTTKPHGSGIGLYLARQIVEAHGGNLILENHPEQGAVAAISISI